MFAELPDVRRREVISVIAHYVSGVLDRDALITSVESLCESADYEVGDSITTLKGSVRGKIVALLDDGRVEWLPDESDMPLRCLPESLRRIKPIADS